MDPIDQEPYIQYLFFKIRLSKFKVFMKILITLWVIGAILSFIYLREHEDVLFRYLWIICSVVAIGESIELMYIIKKSKSYSE